MGSTPDGKSLNGNGLKARSNDVAGHPLQGVRHPFLGLYLFVLALSADLVLLFLEVPALARAATKPLIVAGLLWFFLRHHAGRHGQGWIPVALALSWLGDVLLLFETQHASFFILGLGAFLLAHVAYCTFLLGVWRREGIRLHFPFLLAVAVYYAGLLILLWPGLGNMKVPVAIYGAVISTMLLLALHARLMRGRRAGADLLMGALLFIVSDSLLAINRFYAPFAFAGIAVMLTYGIAQWQLVKGALLYGGARSWNTTDGVDPVAAR